MLNILVLALILMFAAVIGWHLVVALLGGAFVIGTAAWGVVVGTVFALCVAIMLLFILTGIGLLLLGIFAAIWTVVAIVLFPVLFPILAPLFIIILFIIYMRRNQTKKP
jgi:hypothetical protein